MTTIKIPRSHTAPTLPEKSLIAALFGFAFLLYMNTLGHGFAVDDAMAITLNQSVQRGIAGIPDLISNSFYHGTSGENTNLYRPIPLILFAIQTAVAGGKPWAGHLTNVLLFSLNVVLIFIVLRTHFYQKSSVIPVLASALFAAHPIHTEVVANIKSVDEIVCLSGCLVALHYYLRYLNTSSFPQLIKACFAFGLASFSKENAITFLAVLPASALALNACSFKKSGIAVLPLIGVSAFYLLIRAWVIDGSYEDMTIVQNSLVQSSDLINRYATAILILGMYLKLLLFPHPLIWDYSYNHIPLTHFSDWRVWLSLAAMLLLGGLMLYFRNKKPRIAWASLYFFATISLVSNILFLIGTTMGERLTFMPSLGICLLIPMLLTHAFNQDYNTVQWKALKYPVKLVVGFLLLFWSVRTVARNADWKDNRTLFESAIPHAPNSVKVRFSLANEYLNMAMAEPVKTLADQYYSKSISEFKQALKIHPTYTKALFFMGNAYYHSGKTEPAKACYVACVKIDSSETKSLNMLGMMFSMENEVDRALAHFDAAIRQKPDEADGYANKGNLMMMLQKPKEALTALEEARRLDPANKNNLLNLADCLDLLGRSAEAAAVRLESE